AAAEGAEVLRRPRYRSTARLPPAGDAPPLLLKAHRVRTAREGWLARVRRSRARAEWEASRALERAGLPAPRALAWGERWVGGRLRAAFFLAAFLDGRLEFREDHARRGPGGRHRLERGAGRLLRAMHDAGFDHRDMHAGNVLSDPGAEADLALVDLHRHRLARNLRRRRRVAALGKWCHSLGDVMGCGGRLRTLRAYRGDGEKTALRRLYRDVMRVVARLERIRRRSRAKRCLLESTVYTRTMGRGRGARRRDVPCKRLEALLALHDAALASEGDARVAKRGRKSRVTRHGDAVVKEAVPAGGLDRLKAWMASRRRSAGYRHAHLLDVLGVATARPLAWWRVDGRDLTFYEDLSDLERLDHFARVVYRAGDRQRAVCLRDATADWLAHLHRRGIYHGDLKAVNILVREADDGRVLAFPLIDTDRVRFFDHPVDERRVAKNLAQLAASIPQCVTRTERLRWFRRYAAGGAAAGRERRIANRVAVAVARKIVVVDEPIE
ncbi:MAG: lipopolysaccharide kinase InaA family protein, partial [Planctomycetota bacterium]